MRRTLALSIAAAAIFYGATATTDAPPFPRVWTSYRTVNGLDADFRDLRAHGVEAVSLSQEQDLPKLLEAARRHGIKVIPRIDNVRGAQNTLPPDSPDRALMIGGAYNGKAIDRFRFPFKATSHEIVIEHPIYHPQNIYGDFGRYYLGLSAPVRAEAVVKQAEFDGRAHVRRIPATLSRVDDLHWKMRFDLTGVKGDLANVMLAVYWRSTGRFGRFPDAPLSSSKYAKQGTARLTREWVAAWKKANGGTFPSDVVVAVRFGDEDWHVSGKVNVDAMVSYPLWDYADGAVAEFRARDPQREVPIGKAWADVFGRRAYAEWMHSYHEANAGLARVLKETLRAEGLSNVLTFRNITRAGVFSDNNDVDGTGLDALVRELDIAHLDPYPVASRGYSDSVIPVDMSYMAGLARRYRKYLVPWMQAHSYYPTGHFGLIHPEPHHVTKMMDQMRPHRPDAVVWLGYGPLPFSAFPVGKPDSWDRAGEEHRRFFSGERPAIRAQVAAVRPYTVRALRSEERQYPQDHFFTESMLWDVVMRRNWAYDAFEPLDTAELKPGDLRRYGTVLSEIGELSAANLEPFIASGTTSVLFIEGADRFGMLPRTAGIRRFIRSVGTSKMVTADGGAIGVEAADTYELTAEATVLARIGDQPCAWRVGKVVYVAARTKERDADLPAWIWKLTRRS